MARALEIERKFLVHAERLPELPPGARLAQAYLGFDPVVRARTEERPGGECHGYLTIKGAGLAGRDEFEYEIPYDEADALLALSAYAPVRKQRHVLTAEGAPGLKWEIDVFEGENAGLVVAEIELPEPEHRFPRPDWLAEEVTEDPAYRNAALARRPYRAWSRTAPG